jgi:hypothetical protein
VKDETINSVKIPAPKFDLYEAVTLDWNGQTAKGQITDRRYCFDGDVWEYQISGGQYAIGDYITGNSEQNLD